MKNEDEQILYKNYNLFLFPFHSDGEDLIWPTNMWTCNNTHIITGISFADRTSKIFFKLYP